MVTRPLNWSINSMTSSIYRDKVRHTLIFDHWSWNTLKLRFVQGERMWSTDSFNGPKFKSLCLNFEKDILWRHRIYIELLLNKVAVTDNGFSTVNLFGHLKYSKRSRLTWSSRFLVTSEFVLIYVLNEQQNINHFLTDLVFTLNYLKFTQSSYTEMIYWKRK